MLQEITGDRRRLRERLAEHGVMVGRRNQVARPLELDMRRGAVGLGKDDIHRDRRGARRSERAHQPRHVGPWPRPLAELGQGLVVDIDDADRSILIRPGSGALIGVENKVTRLGHDGRVQAVDDQEQGGDDQAGQNGPDEVGHRPPRSAIALARRTGAPASHCPFVPPLGHAAGGIATKRPQPIALAPT